MSEPKYIAIDPGKGVGWATFNEDGSDDEFMTLTEEEVREEFMRRVWDHPPAVICEDWKMTPAAAKFMVWSNMPTAKLIGWLEGVCFMQNIPFHLQGAAVKPNAYKMTGRTPLPKSNPLNHAMDAYVHGKYWLIKNKIWLPT